MNDRPAAAERGMIVFGQYERRLAFQHRVQAFENLRLGQIHFVQQHPPAFFEAP